MIWRFTSPEDDLAIDPAHVTHITTGRMKSRKLANATVPATLITMAGGDTIAIPSSTVTVEDLVRLWGSDIRQVRIGEEPEAGRVVQTTADSGLVRR